MSAKRLIEMAEIVMKEVEAEVGQTVGLGQLVPDDAEGEVLTSVDGSTGFCFHLDNGFRYELHTSAPGKAMLAFESPERRDAIIQKMKFRKYTDNTIIDREAFRAELASVVENGYSVDISERREGCHCIGVPVFDLENRVIAALWVTGFPVNVPLRLFPKISVTLKRASTRLTQLLFNERAEKTRSYVISVVHRVAEQLRNHPENAWDKDEITDLYHISYSWFRSVFREEMGMAPATFLNEQKLRKAKQLLQQTEDSVKTISDLLGFPNQNHFSAFFKRQTGQSPSAFRAGDA